MKKEIKSWKNLESALAGESMAYQKYLYFAKVARKEGNTEVAELFEETAKHENQHAQGHLRHLYPMNELTTEKCLKLAAEGEKFEYTEMYPQYAKQAKEEGASEELLQEFNDGIQECKEHEEIFRNKLKKLESLFNGLSKVEQEHYNNYENALYNFKVTKKDFSKSDEFLKEQL